jgi:hypothetical protein
MKHTDGVSELLAVVTIVACLNYDCLAAGIATRQDDDDLSTFKAE